MSHDPLLAKIHIAKKDLQLDDATYRAVLHGVTGKTSAADLSRFEREAVLARFAELGWKPKSRRGKSPASRHKGQHDKTPTDKIRALWIDMGNLGMLKNPNEYGLNGFVKRTAGVDSVAWLNPAGAYKVIESLKKWCQRETGQADPRDLSPQRRQQIIEANRVG